jgi:hypothetical protein
MDKKFVELFKNVCESFNPIMEGTEDYLPFTRVVFTRKALSDPYLTDRPESLQRVKNLIDSKKQIIVLSPKSIHPTQGSASDGVQGDFYTVAAELTYGFWDVNTKVTVPAGVLKAVKEDGNNLRPVSDDIKRKNRDTKTPEKLDSKLATSNKELPSSQKWNDKQPGGGNTPKKDYTASR